MSIDKFMVQFEIELREYIKKHPYQYSYCKMCRLDAECFTCRFNCETNSCQCVYTVKEFVRGPND